MEVQVVVRAAHSAAALALLQLLLCGIAATAIAAAVSCLRCLQHFSPPPGQAEVLHLLIEQAAGRDSSWAPYLAVLGDQATHPLLLLLPLVLLLLQALVLHLLTERAAGGDSFWAPYLAVLGDQATHPLLWSEALQQQLEGSAMLRTLKTRLQQVQEVSGEMRLLCWSNKMCLSLCTMSILGEGCMLRTLKRGCSRCRSGLGGG